MIELLVLIVGIWLIRMGNRVVRSIETAFTDAPTITTRRGRVQSLKIGRN